MLFTANVTDDLVPIVSALIVEPITRRKNFRLIQIETNCRRHLTLPDMPILDSSSSTASKDVMSKMWTNGDTDIQ